MDMKKKLDEAYLPDKNTKAEKVAVALSGGIDSFVMAYLLKIQKYELFGITAVTGWEDFQGDEKSALSCVVDAPKLARIKEFCHQLNIPHFSVKVSGEFKEEVVENWMIARTTGTLPTQCWSCHEMRMKALYEKAKSMGAKHMATGHYAKLFNNESHGTTFVHSSNDELFDQSALLARLPQEVLKILMLPLSDLQKKEVEKLAENFGLDGNTKALQMHQCFPWNAPEINYILTHIPPRFFKPGEILHAADDSGVSEHEGIIPHVYGEPLATKDGAKPKEDQVFVNYAFKERKIYVSDPGFFKREKIILTDCKVCEETPWHEPLHGSLKISDEHSVDCWVHPKTLNTVFVEWDGAESIKEGAIVAIFRKKGKNSKIYLTGKVKYLSLEKIEEVTDGEKKHVKVDYASDF